MLASDHHNCLGCVCFVTLLNTVNKRCNPPWFSGNFRKARTTMLYTRPLIASTVLTTTQMVPTSMVPMTTTTVPPMVTTTVPMARRMLTTVPRVMAVDTTTPAPTRTPMDPAVLSKRRGIHTMNIHYGDRYIDRLEQERRISSALAMGLRLCGTNPSTCVIHWMKSI